MRKVFKYELAIEDYVEIKMPMGAQVLSVGVQNDMPVLWALVNPDIPEMAYKFRLTGTGHEIDEKEASSMKFVGTCIMLGGSFVLHVFQVVDESMLRNALNMALGLDKIHE